MQELGRLLNLLCVLRDGTWVLKGSNVHKAEVGNTEELISSEDRVRFAEEFRMLVLSAMVHRCVSEQGKSPQKSVKAGLSATEKDAQDMMRALQEDIRRRRKEEISGDALYEEVFEEKPKDKSNIYKVWTKLKGK